MICLIPREMRIDVCASDIYYFAGQSPLGRLTGIIRVWNWGRGPHINLPSGLQPLIEDGHLFEQPGPPRCTTVQIHLKM
jgi:hypothetical protein